MNVSSIVVKCAPKFLPEVLESLRTSGICDVFAHDENGRIVVVVEGDTTEEESEKLKIIQAMAHVLSADMVYAYSENEFAPEEGKFEKPSEQTLDVLNSDIPAEQIIYRGHLKDK